MILQALKEYYERKSDLPRLGFEKKEMPYLIVLSADGRPVDFVSTYEGEGKKRRAKHCLVPQTVKRASNISANLLWDNPEYALGIDSKGKPDRVKEQHEAFLRRVDGLGDIDDAGLLAVRRFLKNTDKKAALSSYRTILDQVIEEGSNLTFQLVGDTCIVAERQAVKASIEALASGGEEVGVCLMTGEWLPITRLHAAIKGVRGAQTSGSNIVSFNLDAFKSFGKQQGANAPISQLSAFAYTTALNHLLSKDSKQKMLVGDATTVFWAEKDCEFESHFSDFFSDPPKDDPDRNTRAVAGLFKAPQSGTFLADGNDRFYVLGLAPNASRIAIRFWVVDTVAGMAKKICQHFEDMKIVHGPKDRDTLSLFRLLVSTASQGKADNIPPNIAGEAMRAILSGLPYPQTLLQAAIRRVRAEHEVTYPRAALIKASINRRTRFDTPHTKEELQMSLDPGNANEGYRLGRLFATLEKIQQEANPGVNATIRDRFYGAASGTPVTVFGNLMRLKNHHLSKLYGRRIYFEKLIGEIMDGLTDFPSHLTLANQGRFAVGYYHQMQKFYEKKTDISSVNKKGA